MAKLLLLITVNSREVYGLYACNGILFNHESCVARRNLRHPQDHPGAGAHPRWPRGSPLHSNLDALRDWGHARDYVRMQWPRRCKQQAPGSRDRHRQQISVRDFITCAATARHGVALARPGSTKWAWTNLPIGSARSCASTRSYFRPAEVQTLLGDPTRARERTRLGARNPLDALIAENGRGRPGTGEAARPRSSSTVMPAPRREDWRVASEPATPAHPCLKRPLGAAKCRSLAMVALCALIGAFGGLAWTRPIHSQLLSDVGLIPADLWRGRAAHLRCRPSGGMVQRRRSAPAPRGARRGHLTRSHVELDLTRQQAVEDFRRRAAPTPKARGRARGGIHANDSYPAGFHCRQPAIALHVIAAAHRFGVRRLLFLGSSCIYPRAWHRSP